MREKLGAVSLIFVPQHQGEIIHSFIQFVLITSVAGEVIRINKRLNVLRRKTELKIKKIEKAKVYLM